MKWMMSIVMLQGVMIMLEKGERRKTAMLTISTLSLLCVACRNQALLGAGRSAVGGLQGYLEDKGLNVVDLGAAMVFYEVCGMVMMLGFWAMCLFWQPAKAGVIEPVWHLLRMAQEVLPCGHALATAHFAAFQISSRLQAKFDWLAKRLHVDPLLLSAAFAEGAIYRNMLKPFLLPLKLYGAYALTCCWRGCLQRAMPGAGGGQL
ncbi:hypothetical protein T484DRAFT_1835957 [Baffinella frigidus]|nr:hypothetical protein T484DRAFT_1835957 [Cryptophyta sp. CCMP2293]|mmetsp:Transcript_28830/g.68766  ORF Transcript_28830/g.68766 Transcript_28830/m.68766 type:complete len:205 (+) Transcript_28830:143-757(+)